MNESLNDPMFGKLNSLYKRSIISIIAGSVLVIALRFMYPEAMRLPARYALMSKSIVIILFLLSVPLTLSYLKKQVGKIPGNIPLSERLSSYMYYFRIKSSVFIVLAVLTILVFLFSGDPMILALLIADVLFYYFERPNHLKVQDDLNIDEEAE